MFIATSEDSLRTLLCDEDLKLDVSSEHKEICVDYRGCGRLYEGHREKYSRRAGCTCWGK